MVGLVYGLKQLTAVNVGSNPTGLNMTKIKVINKLLSSTRLV